MNEVTRQRAYMALMKARTCTDKRFPHVYVCGTHIYFAHGAAQLQQNEYKFFENIDVPIEVVTYEEAVKAINPSISAGWRKHVDFNIMSAELEIVSKNTKRLTIK